MGLQVFVILHLQWKMLDVRCFSYCNLFVKHLGLPVCEDRQYLGYLDKWKHLCGFSSYDVAWYLVVASSRFDSYYPTILFCLKGEVGEAWRMW